MMSARFLIVSLFVLLLLPGIPAVAQQATDFTGSWQVVQVDMVKEAAAEEKKMLAQVEKIFLKSSFRFEANGGFSFDAPAEDLAIPQGV